MLFFIFIVGHFFQTKLYNNFPAGLDFMKHRTQGSVLVNNMAKI